MVASSFVHSFGVNYYYRQIRPLTNVTFSAWPLLLFKDFGGLRKSRIVVIVPIMGPCLVLLVGVMKCVNGKCKLPIYRFNLFGGGEELKMHCEPATKYFLSFWFSFYKVVLGNVLFYFFSIKYKVQASLTLFGWIIMVFLVWRKLLQNGFQGTFFEDL